MGTKIILNMHTCERGKIDIYIFELRGKIDKK